jgi:hypothetical protein
MRWLIHGMIRMPQWAWELRRGASLAPKRLFRLSHGVSELGAEIEDLTSAQ